MRRRAGTVTRPVRRRPLVRGAVLCLLLSAQYSALAIAQDVPLVGQPTAHFYGARGAAVKVAWSLDRATVPEDEEIVATLTVKGATNPRQVVRPDLKKLPEFQSCFV